MNVLQNVYICVFRKNGAPLLPGGGSKINTSGTIANSQTDRLTDRQRTLTKTNKNGAVVKVRILVELGML